MQPRVTAILVCANGADFIDRTLDALAGQTRPPENLAVVDVGSTDGSTDGLEFGGSATVVRIPRGRSFGDAITQGERASSDVALGDADAGVDEWLWLIGHDNAPAPGALEALLRAVEIAPSVAVAGPKLMAIDDPFRIAEFGESMTRLGRSVALVHDELDQGQHDSHTDVLAVGAAGMLVRRSVWIALGGFDPALPSVDAALDFCVRVRLAGHRVTVVPSARVATAGAIEDFGRASRLSDGRRARIHRQAQLHRRMTYAPAAALWIHWLSLVPLAIARALGHLVGKHPSAVGSELGAAFAVAFSARPRRSRAALAKTRRVSWTAIEPLRVQWRSVRERRITSRDVEIAQVEDAAVARASFFGDGGMWVVLGAALVSAVALFGLFGSPALTGGGLLPLSDDVGQLWRNVGYGWHAVGTGFTGPSDPFTAVLAVLGSITFWSPSTAIVLVMLLALPLAATSAWFAIRQVTTRRWVPAVGAAIYAIAPTLVASVMTGHLGAVLVHVALPWFLLLLRTAHRSWASSAGAALLFALIVAASPSLVPVMLIIWLAAVAFGARHWVRRIAIPVPAAVLFLPLVLAQIARGTPLAIAADPGVPVADARPNALQLAMGAPIGGANGWAAVVGGSPVITSVVTLAAGLVLLPILLTALGALLGHRWIVACGSIVLALLGYATAVAATHVGVASVGSASTTLWPGGGLSVMAIGVVLAAAIGLDTLPRLAPGLAILASVLSFAAVAPALAGMYLGTAALTPTTGRVISAYVNAQAQTDPGIGTLVLLPQPDGSLAATLERGAGPALDDQATWTSTAPTLSASAHRISVLAANLASRSGFDPRSDLRQLGVRFVLLQNGVQQPGSETVQARAAASIGQNALFTSVGTTATGVLYSYGGAIDHRAGATAASRSLHALTLLVFAVVFGATALLAIPTAPRRRHPVGERLEVEEPATTFDEERDE
ncbi:glycosyltransferase family 2 protein [Curtobacterium ammoniigenes]|uniref:glycosyltransferase family 2 protein n=1 Tax=Curtobacterium ammoniigenes TaxID=395387 RepID=UPI000835C956|nr:glycosyltransferase family 2 protein [Curtobacterium ammoniigenes]